MFGKSQNAKNKTDKGVTLIAANTEVVGDVVFKHQLFVNGRINGNVLVSEDPDATVVISDCGSVTGEIRVPNVVVNGMVDGDVYGSGRVELAANARIKGNVYYNLIEMQLGAMVDGKLVHTQNADAEAANVHHLKKKVDPALKAEGE